MGEAAIFCFVAFAGKLRECKGYVVVVSFCGLL